MGDAKTQRSSAAQRQTEAVARAKANAPLMEQDRESVAAYKRGEKPIPWDEVKAEADSRGG